RFVGLSDIAKRMIPNFFNHLSAQSSIGATAPYHHILLFAIRNAIIYPIKMAPFVEFEKDRVFITLTDGARFKQGGVRVYMSVITKVIGQASLFFEIVQKLLQV